MNPFAIFSVDIRHVLFSQGLQLSDNDKITRTATNNYRTLLTAVYSQSLSEYLSICHICHKKLLLPTVSCAHLCICTNLLQAYILCTRFFFVQPHCEGHHKNNMKKGEDIIHSRPCAEKICNARQKSHEQIYSKPDNRLYVCLHQLAERSSAPLSFLWGQNAPNN